MTRALVTGGTGFVGSAVVRALLRRGIAVRCLVRPASPRINLEGLDVELIQGDLGNRTSLERALADCQQLYHVAAFYSTQPEDAGRMVQTNVEGSRNILELAADMGLQRIVYTSTIGTIGHPHEDRLPTEEDLFDAWETASPYARSKLEAEALALDLAGQGAPLIVVNPCSPIGPRDIKPSSSGQRLLDYARGRVPSFSSGGINLISVDDVAEGHFLAAAKGRVGQRYILGNAEGNLMRSDFDELMLRATGIEPPQPPSASVKQRILGRLRRLLRPPQPIAAMPIGYRPSALTANPQRAIDELGLPQTDLEDAVRDAMAWFREHGYLR